MEKISFEDYFNFLSKYERHGRPHDLRLGQYFMNERMPCSPDPELYYLRDDEKAKDYIISNYVNYH